MINNLLNHSRRSGFSLPPLPYMLDTLEPYISNRTLQLHHEVHLKLYISNLNSLIAGTKFENVDIETIIRVADGPIYNNAAMAWNHSFFFDSLKPGQNTLTGGPFVDLINLSFGSVLFFKESFVKKADNLFGSGWVWLVRNPDGVMEIVTEPNAGNPLRSGKVPLLVCDLWEHAYYLDFHNKRDYMDAFWTLVNWNLVEKRYINAL